MHLKKRFYFYYSLIGWSKNENISLDESIVTFKYKSTRVDVASYTLTFTLDPISNNLTPSHSRTGHYHYLVDFRL